MSLDAAGIDLGPITVRYAGLIVVLAVLAGNVLSGWQARRHGEDPGMVVDLSLWCLVGALIGGRLFFILAPPPSIARFYDRAWYVAHFFDLQAGPLAIWSGGLETAGMLVGGSVGVLVVLWRRGVDVWRWADILTPGLLLSLSLLPWANILNRQLYGPPTDLPWGMVVPHPIPPYEDETLRFHPTPAYLALWAALVLGAVWWMRWRYGERLQSGDSFLVAMALYSVGLMVADWLRVDVGRLLLGLSGTQVVALVMFAGAVGMSLRRHGAGLWR